METTSTVSNPTTSTPNVQPNANGGDSIRPFDLEMAKNKRKHSTKKSTAPPKKPKKPEPHRSMTFEEKQKLIAHIDSQPKSYTQADAAQWAFEKFSLVSVPISYLQPLDQGIISCVKARFKKNLIRSALQKIDSGKFDSNKLYNINQLTAMRWIQEIWSELPSSVISNCWKHSQLLDNRPEPPSLDQTKTNRELVIAAELTELSTVMSELPFPNAKITAAEYLDLAGEAEVHEEFNEEDCLRDEIAPAATDKEEEEEMEDLPLQQRIAGLSYCLAFVELIPQQKDLCRLMTSFLQSLKAERTRKAHQSSIPEFFVRPILSSSVQNQ